MNPQENKTCAICLGSVATGRGQAIFTAECSHTFHFSCIGHSVTHGNHLCPLCRAPWNDLPFIMSTLNPHMNNPISPFISSDNSPRTPTRNAAVRPELVQFSDDEPLLTPNNPMSAASLQNVAIKAIPERPAVAALASIPSFAVLVGLKAPPLSDNVMSVNRAPIDLVMVLDVSGSMHGSKLALLKRAANFVIDNLGPFDRLSVVSFSTSARRIFPLCRMVERGRDDAKQAVNALSATGLTNIVEALKKGVQVLEERLHQNPVASIIFLSDGQDTCRRTYLPNQMSSPRQSPPYLHLLPASICPSNRGPEDQGNQQIFPVHTFGFGLDHDPYAMHAISDSSGGTFSFIESYEMVQDAFASCIGGLLSTVAQELRLSLRSASHEVQIISIPSGRYASEITNQGSQGTIDVGDVYADEEKEFLINVSVPMLMEATEQKTSLLDIMCSYRDAVTQEVVRVEGDLVEIRRPEAPTPPDNAVNLEVDRQRNRLAAAETITEATRMAEAGNLTGAQTLLSNTRSNVLASPAGQARENLSICLEAEMKEMEERMGNLGIYQRTGRAYALSNMSAHSRQRASTRHSMRLSSVGGNASGSGGDPTANFVVYGTPQMARMVQRSQQLDEDTMQG